MISQPVALDGRAFGAAAWPVRVDAGCLCDFARAGDQAALQQLGGGARRAAPAVWRYPLLLHPFSAPQTMRLAPRLPQLSPRGQELAAALAAPDGGFEVLVAAWRGTFRQRATRVGHRFDLQADYLAAAREFVLSCLVATPAALPPTSEDGQARLIETLADSVRAGAMKYADREIYRLTKQMVREGVLTWRDERGRVVEHPCLRQHEADPAPLVSEREFRRELKTFVARYGSRLLGPRTWERFRLHTFAGWTQAEIAAHQQVSQQAVSESLATAAVKLREAFLTHRRATPPR